MQCHLLNAKKNVYGDKSQKDGQFFKFATNVTSQINHSRFTLFSTKRQVELSLHFLQRKEGTWKRQPLSLFDNFFIYRNYENYLEMNELSRILISLNKPVIQKMEVL